MSYEICWTKAIVGHRQCWNSCNRLRSLWFLGCFKILNTPQGGLGPYPPNPRRYKYFILHILSIGSILCVFLEVYLPRPRGIPPPNFLWAFILYLDFIHWKAQNYRGFLSISQGLSACLRPCIRVFVILGCRNLAPPLGCRNLGPLDC